MRNAIRLLCGALLIFLAARPASAATRTWDGDASTDWQAAANWVGNVAPVAGDAIIVGAGPFPSNRAPRTNSPTFALGNVSIGYAGAGGDVKTTAPMTAATVSVASGCALGVGATITATTFSGDGTLADVSASGTVISTRTMSIQFYTPKSGTRLVFNGTGIWRDRHAELTNQSTVFFGAVTITGAATVTTLGTVLVNAGSLTINDGGTLALNTVNLRVSADVTVGGVGGGKVQGNGTLLVGGNLTIGSGSSFLSTSGLEFQLIGDDPGTLSTSVPDVDMGSIRLVDPLVGTKVVTCATGFRVRDLNVESGTRLDVTSGTATVLQTARLSQGDFTLAAGATLLLAGTTQSLFAAFTTLDGDLRTSGSGTKTVSDPSFRVNGRTTVGAGTTLLLPSGLVSGSTAYRFDGPLDVPAGAVLDVRDDVQLLGPVTVSGTMRAASADAVTMRFDEVEAAALTLASGGTLQLGTGAGRVTMCSRLDGDDWTFVTEAGFAARTLGLLSVRDSTASGEAMPIHVPRATDLTGNTNWEFTPVTHFSLAGPSSVTAGALALYTVTALDGANAKVTTYTGTVAFASSDPAASVPASTTLTAGTGTFAFTLRTAGAQTLQAFDEDVPTIATTSSAIAVAGRPATRLAISGPSQVTRGVAAAFTLAAADDFGNADATYAGTISLASSDGAATLPSSVSATGGTAAFQATLATEGPQTLSAADLARPSITGTSAPIDVLFAGTLEFSAPVFRAREPSGTATITIVRTGGSGAASVDLDVEDGTAIGGVDFVPGGGALTFPAGASARTVTIAALDRGAFHAPLSARLSLGSAGVGTLLGAQRFAALAIDDDLAPEITTASLRAGSVGSPYHAEVLAGDGGTGPGFLWRVSAGAPPPGVMLASGGGRAAALEGAPLAAGSFAFTLEATDLGAPGQVATRALSILVVTANAGVAPVFGTQPAPAAAVVGRPYELVLAATLGSPPYRWSIAAGALPAGLALDPLTGRIAGVAAAPLASSTLSVQVTDAQGRSPAAALSLPVLAVDAPLAIATLSLPEGTAGRPYEQPVHVEGGVGPAFAWAIASGAPPSGIALVGMGRTAALAGTPTASGDFAITVEAQEGAASAGADLLLRVRAATDPAIATEALGPFTVSVSASARLTASGGTDSLAWTSGALPPGLLLDAATGAVTGTPVASGTFAVRVAARDAGGREGARTYQVTVASPPAIVTGCLPDAVAGNGYAASLEATGGAPPLSWSAVGLPAGLTLSASSGLVSGVPSTTASPLTFVATVADANGATETRTVALRVLASATHAVVTSSLPRAEVGAPYAALLVATGGAGARTWSVASGALPSWAALDAASGLISGTPTAAPLATLTVQSSDAAATPAVAASGALTIETLAPLEVATARVDLPLGRPASATLEASGASGAVAWSVAGPLPAGLAFEEGGDVSGTPSQAGTFLVLVRATDSAGRTAAATVEARVAPSSPSGGGGHGGGGCSSAPGTATSLAPQVLLLLGLAAVRGPRRVARGKGVATM